MPLPVCGGRHETKGDVTKCVRLMHRTLCLSLKKLGIVHSYLSTMGLTIRLLPAFSDYFCPLFEWIERPRSLAGVWNILPTNQRMCELYQINSGEAIPQERSLSSSLILRARIDDWLLNLKSEVSELFQTPEAPSNADAGLGHTFRMQSKRKTYITTL